LIHNEDATNQNKKNKKKHKVLSVVVAQSYQRKNGSQQIMKAPIIMPRVRAALCSVLQLALCCLTVVPAIKGTFQPYLEVMKNGASNDKRINVVAWKVLGRRSLCLKLSYPGTCSGGGGGADRVGNGKTAVGVANVQVYGVTDGPMKTVNMYNKV
jgi:hypothetical protein